MSFPHRRWAGVVALDRVPLSVSSWLCWRPLRSSSAGRSGVRRAALESGVVARAIQLEGRVTFGAAVVMLGITNRHMSLAQQLGFADRVVKIVADPCADLGAPELPVLHTDYEVESTDDLAVDTEVGQRFRPLILSLPMRISRCAIVPADGTGTQDDHHLDLAGQKLWGERAIQILVDRGWGALGGDGSEVPETFTMQHHDA